MSVEDTLLFSRSVVSNSLRPHGLQRARLHSPSPSPRVCSNSLLRWFVITPSSAGETSSLEVQGSDDIVGCIWSLSGGRIPSSSEDLFLSSKSFQLMRRGPTVVWQVMCFAQSSCFKRESRLFKQNSCAATSRPVTDHLYGYCVEKEMATHSSVLAWRTPRTEEPGGLQSTGLQRVGHGWGSWAHARAPEPGCWRAMGQCRTQGFLLGGDENVPKLLLEKTVQLWTCQDPISVHFEWVNYTIFKRLNKDKRQTQNLELRKQTG